MGLKFFLTGIISGEAKATDDAESVEWLPVNELKDLAIDHNKILKDYRQWIKTKIPIGHQRHRC